MENKEYDDEVDDNYNPEEEVTGDWKVKGLDLPEVEKTTGEEQEEELASFRTKLYRFRDSQWKERGVGHLKLLKHKQSNKIRAIMRSDKTHKLVCNFYVKGPKPLCQVVVNKTAEKTWVFSCFDASDETPAVEKLCTKFTSQEECDRFKVEFEKAYEANEKLFAEGEKKEEEKKEE